MNRKLPTLVFVFLALFCFVACEASAPTVAPSEQNNGETAKEPTAPSTVETEEVSSRESVLKWVDPFIGTGGFGHNYPGATVPFGMIQPSPDTELHSYAKGYRWCAGYSYEDNTIVGFSHTHFSGTGHSDMGDILLMPYTGETQIDPGTAQDPDTGYRSRFSHDDEEASPGYYRVKLQDDDVDVELTATKRAALHRYSFPTGREPKVLLDLVHSIYHYEGKVSFAEIRVENETTITGYRRTHGWAPDRAIYFAIEFSRPFETYSIYNQDKPTYRGFGTKGSKLDNFPNVQGRKLKANFEFKTSSDPLLVKVAISGVDIKGALNNLKSELPKWDFETVRKQASLSWQKELSPVQIEGTPKEKENFYTALYHTYLAPVLYMDADRRYRGLDGDIHRAENFDNHTIFSLWDTYRALHPLFTILQPKRNAQMIKSMLAHFEQSAMNMLPIWSFHGNETWCMIGYHAVSVISDAFLKGTEGIDTKHALKAMVTTAQNPNYGGLKHYMTHNFVPIDLEKEGASKTLEYAYNDWSIAKMAQKLGKTDIAKRFFKRSQNFRNIYDSETDFMRAKKSDGTFREPFDPLYAQYGGDYTEGNAWQYSWYVPHDTAALIEMMGGDQAFSDKLDQLFEIDTTQDKYGDVEDIAGLIGQYAHGNEPSHNTAYLYIFAGAPWKTQERLHEIMNGLFDNTPQGIPGNEDCGQMSAWYIFTSLGFYPVSPGSSEYAIGIPFLDAANITLPNGNTFKMSCKERTEKNKYLKQIKLNGKDLGRSYITHKDIASGAHLEFIMGSEPNKSWGSGPKDRPYSFSTHADRQLLEN